MIIYDKYLLDENKDTIVLIHGWNLTKEYMNSFINVYKNNFNIINVDLFKKIDKSYEVGTFIDELHRIISSYSKKNVVIIAHSFGGKLAYFYSEKYQVKSCLLIAPSLIKPRFSLLKILKIRLYKCLKKMNMKIPLSLRGSKDYRFLKDNMKYTFLNCFKVYLKNKSVNETKFLIVGFNKDKEVKKYQISKISKYIKNTRTIFYDGDHFSYLDYIKEICLEFNGYLF